jgi:hypothetical protein
MNFGSRRAVRLVLALAMGLQIDLSYRASAVSQSHESDLSHARRR